MASDNQTDGSTTYRGIVRCRSSKQPIPGATVVVQRNLKSKTILKTTHVTDENGGYEFEISAEHASLRRLYIQMDVTHDDFVPLERKGYSYSMTMNNQSLGSKLWFCERWLVPAAQVMGQVVDPDGRPMAGVEVSGYSEPDPDLHGSWSSRETDENGRFVLNLHIDGLACIWIDSDEYANKQIVIDRTRGDLGTIQVDRGIQIEGSVSDFQGHPAAGVCVRIDDLDAFDEMKAKFHPVSFMGRDAKTDQQGRFVMPPVGEGNHRLRVVDWGPLDDTGTESGSVDLPGCFLPKKISVSNKPGQQFNLQAIEHVYVRGESFDHLGQPRDGHLPSIWGTIGDEGFNCEAKRTEKGKFEIRVPKGLADCCVSIMTDDHTEYIVEYRNHRPGIGECFHLQNLAPIDEDSDHFRITWYDCPFLMVKVKQDGEFLNATKWHITAQHEGANGYVTFERQSDGRHRSCGLLPDRELKMQVAGDGFEKDIEGIVVGHKEIKELVVEV